MLPWFVGVQDDLESLEVIEGGTWTELAHAHRDMVSPRATPSGLANRYGAIPYRFPAATEISGLGPLSDALVCRRRWDSPLVMRDREILLCGDASQRHAYLRAWRQRAVEVAIEAFEIIRQVEEEVFQDKSYFRLKRESEEGGFPMAMVAPDPDDMSAEDLLSHPSIALNFAEEGESDLKGGVDDRE